MKYSLQSILHRYDNKQDLSYIFFWGHTEDDTLTPACFSQWYPSNFKIGDVYYNSAEQYMMAQKALLFNDVETYNKILLAKTPKQFKNLGRCVSDFSECIWNKNKYDIVVKANVAKFSQNPHLKDFLINTNDKILVEASPYDKIWGIGKSAYCQDIENPYTWEGENLLGFALMEVRDIIV